MTTFMIKWLFFMAPNARHLSSVNNLFPEKIRKNKRMFFVALFTLVGLFTYRTLAYSTLPPIQFESDTPLNSLTDFSTHKQTKLKKKAFIALLNPIIREENQHIATLRHQLIKLKETSSKSLPKSEKKWLEKLTAHYKVLSKNNINKPKVRKALIKRLLLKVDRVPASLVLAQAAIESGWGSSRFARKGNNLFGQWCFKAGCGIVPKQRVAGLKHEVHKFDSINQSIRAYLLNLNSFPAYKEFRQIREKMRQKKIAPSVFALANGLTHYSSQGSQYVVKVKKVIRLNNLEQYDRSDISLKKKMLKYAP